MSPFSGWLAKKLIRVQYVSLVNLILNKESVKELLQENLTSFKLVSEMRLLLSNSQKINEMLSDYQELEERLGTGSPMKKITEKILEFEKRK